MPTTPINIDLDLVGTYCPMAFVKLSVFIEKLEDNSVFTVLYENTPANEPLVRSIEALGHNVINTHIINPENDPPNSVINKHPITEKKITLIIMKVQVKK